MVYKVVIHLYKRRIETCNETGEKGSKIFNYVQ